MGVLLICGAAPQYEQELQSPGANTKEGHVCHTSLGYARRSKYCCHDNAIKIGDMVKNDNWTHSLRLYNVLPSFDSHAEEVEAKMNEQ